MNQRPIILHIDTHDSESVRIKLQKDGKNIERRVLRKQSDQAVLPLIEQLFKAENIRIEDVGAIEVHSGPGSYTGLRVGASVANTISWLFDISVNGNPVGIYNFSSYALSRFDL